MRVAWVIYISGIIPAFLFTRHMWYKTYPEYKQLGLCFGEVLLWTFYSLFSWMGFGAAFLASKLFKN